jgi:RNA exonuclease 4
MMLFFILQTIPVPAQDRRPRVRGRRRRNKKAISSNEDLSDSSSITSSSSDDISKSSSSTSSSPRRKVPRKQKSSKKQQQPQPKQQLTLEEQAQYVAMDCEMVGVGPNGFKSALARVTIVNWNHEIVLDQFIRPEEPVTDYRSFVSGITPDDLKSDDAVDIYTCRLDVLQILKGKVLVGHALKNDLAALGIQHSWQNTRDTAKYEPFMKIRFVNDSVLWPRKLKDLCHEKLAVDIQQPGQPHSAYEDAVAALALYRTVRTKWEKVMEYKIKKTAMIEQQTQGNNEITT